MALSPNGKAISSLSTKDLNPSMETLLIFIETSTAALQFRYFINRNLSDD
jgi:hypothetical protein